MEEKKEEQENKKLENLMDNYWDTIEECEIDYEINVDGKLMSHVTVAVDDDGQPKCLKD